MPLAAWLLCESFIRWAGSWPPADLDAAATRLEEAIVARAAAGGLGAQVRAAAGAWGWGLGLGSCG